MLLQIALHPLNLARERDAEHAAAEALIRTYENQDAAPMAHVVLAREALARGRAPEPAHVDAAPSSSERVVTLFPGDTESAPATLHGTADTRRMAER